MGSFGEATVSHVCYIASPKLLIYIYTPYPTLRVGLLAKARLRRFMADFAPYPTLRVGLLATARLRRFYM